MNIDDFENFLNDDTFGTNLPGDDASLQANATTTIMPPQHSGLGIAPFTPASPFSILEEAQGMESQDWSCLNPFSTPASPFSTLQTELQDIGLNDDRSSPALSEDSSHSSMEDDLQDNFQQDMAKHAFPCIGKAAPPLFYPYQHVAPCNHVATLMSYVAQQPLTLPMSPALVAPSTPNVDANQYRQQAKPVWHAHSTTTSSVSNNTESLEWHDARTDREVIDGKSRVVLYLNFTNHVPGRKFLYAQAHSTTGVTVTSRPFCNDTMTCSFVLPNNRTTYQFAISVYAEGEQDRINIATRCNVPSLPKKKISVTKRAKIGKERKNASLLSAQGIGAYCEAYVANNMIL